MFKISKRKFQWFSREDVTGFTLIEAIVAIGVISVGFVGSLVLLSKASSQAVAVKDRVVAAHLAAEGVEVIRNIRDTNWLKGRDWLNGLIEPSDAPTGTIVSGVVNYDSGAIDSSDSSEPRKCLNWDGSFYRHAAAPAYVCTTSFGRQIVLQKKEENISGQNISYLEIKSAVQWKEKGVIKSLTVIDHLYDWK